MGRWQKPLKTGTMSALDISALVSSALETSALE
jgi:hypothetical protein